MASLGVHSPDFLRMESQRSIGWKGSVPRMEYSLSSGGAMCAYSCLGDACLYVGSQRIRRI